MLSLRQLSHGWRPFVGALTILAFAALVSLAATHLHVVADDDAACAICTAVVGKVNGPSAPPALGVAPDLGHPQPIVPNERPRALAPSFVVPPSRGPPFSP